MKQPENTLRGSESAQMERVHILVMESIEAVQTAQRHLRAAVEDCHYANQQVGKSLHK